MGLVRCLLSILCWCVLSEQYAPIQEETLKFDVDKKKTEPLPSCIWNYKYDIAKTVISALCFLMGMFILVFGK